MTKARAKSKRSNAELRQVEQKQAKQQKQIAAYEKNQRLMKWIALGILILILLALLAAGYATDWTRGLKKDASIGSLDSSNQGDGSGANDGTGGTGADGGNGSTGGGGNTSTNTTTNNSSTTNNTTNNNPPGGGGDDSTLLDELIQLYNETNTGDNINDTINRANEFGIDVDCTNDVVTQDCRFSADDSSFTTRNLLGTGTVTGILDEVNL